MDLTAITMCQENNIPIVIFNLNKRGNIKRVVTGEKVGSLILAHSWLRHWYNRKGGGE